MLFFFLFFLSFLSIMAFKPSVYRYSSKPSAYSESEDDIADEINNAERAIVLFSSSHSSCKYMNHQYALTVQNYLSSNQESKIFAIDAIEHPEVAEALGIRTIPSIATLKKGSLQKCSIGALSNKQIEDMLI